MEMLVDGVMRGQGGCEWMSVTVYVFEGKSTHGPSLIKKIVRGVG